MASAWRCSWLQVHHFPSSAESTLFFSPVRVAHTVILTLLGIYLFEFASAHAKHTPLRGIHPTDIYRFLFVLLEIFFSIFRRERDGCEIPVFLLGVSFF